MSSLSDERSVNPLDREAMSSSTGGPPAELRLSVGSSSGTQTAAGLSRGFSGPLLGSTQDDSITPS